MFSHGEAVLIILSCHLCTLTFVSGPPCRAGLNELYAATQKSLKTEQKLRQQLEQELQLQKSIRQEKEVENND